MLWKFFWFVIVASQKPQELFGSSLTFIKYPPGSLFNALFIASFAVFMFVWFTKTDIILWFFLIWAACPIGFPNGAAIPVESLSAPAPDANGFSLMTWWGKTFILN